MKEILRNLYINGNEIFRIELDHINNEELYYISNDEFEVLERCSLEQLKEELKKYQWILDTWDKKLLDNYLFFLAWTAMS